MTGKPVGADIARRKKTLPLLYGLRRSAELRLLMAQETLSKADVGRARDLLEAAGSRAYAEQLARQHHEQALAALDRAALHQRVDEGLRSLAESLLDRER